MTLTVLVPSSIVRESEDQREATRKLGYVARAATIFRADRLVVFPDGEGERRWGGNFVRVVLEYAATPPYLRKEVWGQRDELQYVGVLPPLLPLRTGSESSELREGIVTEVGPDGRVRVTCGMQHPISLRTPPDVEVSEGERVTIRVSSREPVRARIVDEPPPGYTIVRSDLPEALAHPDAGTTVASSRYGAELSVMELADMHTEGVLDGDLTVAFGAPARGLPAILGADPEEVPADPSAEAGSASVEPDRGFDLWLNTIPHQGSEVVRTEEALFVTLAALTLQE
jgi:predicted SPOUT superfamily RNA methylase MTH1